MIPKAVARAFDPRNERPVMVMDIAESDQAGAQWQLLSSHRGRIAGRVESGVVMEFADARSCLQAAFALGGFPQARGAQADAARPPLRAAAHLARCSPAQDGILARDLKLASGLAAVAEPGELLLTAELRDRLADGVDADFEDLGRRRVEPLVQPVRLFRAHAAPGEIADSAIIAQRDLRPGLAVIPFQGGATEPQDWVVGELIAEGVIARLSHSIGLRVISRQSTSALRGRGGLGEVERHLGAAFVLTGNYSMQGRKLVVRAELAQACSRTLLWSGQLQGTVDDLLQEESELARELAAAVAQALKQAQVREALTQPLPRLDSSVLMLAGISMTHSHSASTFARGREALTELTLRHPKLALPRAWLAMWYALNVVKGQSGDVAGDTRRAREQTLRALSLEPHNAMALAVEGYIHCQLLGNPEQAGRALNAAIEANPSEPMAWLFKSLSSCMWGSTSASVTEVYIARSLSPVDPLRYFFDLLTGNALLADRRYEQAIDCLHRSLRANKRHAPALRLLSVAQAELGRIDEAKDTLGLLLAEVPGLTVSSYLSMGSADSPLRQRCASAMRLLGLPER